MRKITAFWLALVLLLSLTSCGKKGAEAPLPAETESVTEKASEPAVKAVPAEVTAEEPETIEETEAETEAETESAPEEEKASVSLLHVTVEEISKREGNCCDEYEIVRLTDEDAAAYPDLAAALLDQAGQEEYRSGERMLQLEENYEELKDSREEDFALDSAIRSNVVRADSRILSIYHHEYMWLGGAHPSYYLCGDSFDTETGMHLRFTDVVTDPEKFFDLVEEKLKEKYADDYPYMNDFTEYRKNLSYEEYRNVAWITGYDGVTVFFNPYELGPYAMGYQVITVPFEEAPEVYSDRFTAVPEEYVIPLCDEFPAELDVKGSGKREEVFVEAVSATPEEEYAYAYNYVIHAGKRSVTLEDGTYSSEGFVIRKDGKYYLYLFETSDNDYVILSVTDLQTMENDPEQTMIVKVKSEPGDWRETENGYLSTWKYWPLTDPASMLLVEHCEILGTKSGERIYSAGPDGIPVPEEEWITFAATMALKTRKDIACKEVSPDGKELSDAVIPEGTCLLFVRSDNEEWVDVQETAEENLEVIIEEYGSMVFSEEPLKAEEGKTLYRIMVDPHAEWPFTVNGTDESELFYGIQYAG